MPYTTVKEAIAEIKSGKMIILTDSGERENEGDFVMAAEYVTPAAINFMARYGRGLICAPLTQTWAARLGLKPMCIDSSDPLGTAFTISIDHKDADTGISAFERALTLKKLSDPDAAASDFRQPGHCFPLIARSGGTLERNGHTEATVDLMKLAGCSPVGVICEILATNGRMARQKTLEAISGKYNLKILRIQTLIDFIKQKNPISLDHAPITLPTVHGLFNLYAFPEYSDKEPHLALVYSQTGKNSQIPLVRVHSECLTGDVFNSARCDCGYQLDKALAKISESGSGILIYLRQEGRGIGLIEKLKAYKLQDEGFDTVEANLKLGLAPDLRDYTPAVNILKKLGFIKISLLTNNPDKINCLSINGIEITRRIPLESEPNIYNYHYLETKKNRMGHLLKEIIAPADEKLEEKKSL